MNDVAPAPTLIVAAGVVIEQNRVLLTRRKKGSHLAGAWEFPGGKAEPGEDPRETLRRELKEECGIDVTVHDILDVTFYVYEPGPRRVLLLFFMAERLPSSPEPRPIDVDEVRWASANELDPSCFPPADVAVVAKVARLLERRVPRENEAC